ncbi:tetraacyldisaccharide 4'-kinase [Frateuria aurantia]
MQARWYSARPIWWACPLAALFALLTSFRRLLYRRGRLQQVRLPVPVVVVGNISVGGTGKTPLTIAVAKALQAAGYRPGVVSRGYGGSQQTPALLNQGADPARYGDEPCLIRDSGIEVAVGRDRPAAAWLLLAMGCDIILADDGLQHYRLARDIEICVIDGVRRFGNGWLLPAGPLREPVSRAAATDFRVCNGSEPGPGEWRMRLIGDQAVNIRMPTQRRALTSWQGQSVHAVAGIGHPPRFFQMLREAGMRVIEHAFPDHHRFQAADLAFGDQLPVVMTAKDAVKCQALAGGDCWYVPVQADLEAAFFQQLLERLSIVAGQAGAASPRALR